VAGGIRLDIRRFPPADVVAIALGPERREQQNVRKLAGRNASTWHALVDLVAAERANAHFSHDILGQQAIDGLRRDQTTLERIGRDGVPVQRALAGSMAARRG
jgi:hypothetical protein